MSESNELSDWVKEWRAEHPLPRAIICDIDDTICRQLDVAISCALSVLQALDSEIVVHYVTARPELARKITVEFLLEQRLPGWKNLHLCPNWQSTLQHKTETMTKIAKEHQVIVSIGDADEDEIASNAAGVPFVRVIPETIADAWAQVTELLSK